MSRRGIKEDFAVGSAGEAIVSAVLLGAVIFSTPNVQKNDQYDLSCHHNILGHFTVEVKYDVMAEKTGNLALEFYNTRLGKPSGIDATKADLWAIVLSDKTVWLTRCDTLKRFIAENKAKRIITSGGDNNASLYLYDKDFALGQIFSRLDHLDTGELLLTLHGLLHHGEPFNVT